MALPPMPSREDVSMITAFEDIYNELNTKQHKLKLYVLNNECSRTVKKIVEAQQTAIQIVEPHNHCVNAAEPAVKAEKFTPSPVLPPWISIVHSSYGVNFPANSRHPRFNEIFPSEQKILRLRRTLRPIQLEQDSNGTTLHKKPCLS